MSAQKKHKYIVAAFLLGTVLQSPAQDTVSLKGLIDQALQENYDIRIARNEQQKSEVANTIGNAGMLPSLDVVAEQTVTINNTQQVFYDGQVREANAAQTRSLAAGAQLNWVVFDGFQMFARKNQLEHLEQLGLVNTRYFMEQTVSDLALAYYQLGQEQLLLEAYRQSLEISQRRLQIAEAGFNIGAFSRLDVQQALMDRNADSSLVLDQKRFITELQFSVNQIINAPAEYSLRAINEITLTEELDLNALLLASRESNAQLDQQQLEELIAMEEARIAQGTRYPQVELFGNLAYSKSASEVGLLQSNLAYGPNFGARVRFNLFDGGRTNIANKVADLEVGTQKLETAQALQDIETSVRIAHNAWETASAQVEMEKESVATARKTLEITQKQLEVGAITDVEFRVTQLSALQAEVRYIQALFRAKSNEIRLYRLSGQIVEKVL